MDSFLEYFGRPNAAMRGAIVSVFLAGAWIGSAAVGITSDRLGRRRAMAFGCIWGAVGGALMAGATHVSMLIIGRILIGYAIGSLTGIAPVFGAEIAKNHERARVTGINQMLLTLGFLVASWTGVGEGHMSSKDQWRLGFAIQVIPSIILGVGVLFVSESPRWLLLKGRSDEAAKAFRSYHYNESNAEWCDQEFLIIQANINEELNAQSQLTWGQLAKNSAFRKRLFVGTFVMASSMLSGISFVQYYQTAIYKTLQYNHSQVLLINGLYGVVAPVACFISLFYLDRISRRKVLIASTSLLSISFTIITILAARFPAIPGQPTNEAAQRGLIACIFSVSAYYSGALGPMQFVIPPEVFTTALRAKANAIVQITHYSLSLIITQCSPIAMAKVGWKYYILFICSNAFCAVVFFLTYPDLKGKSLEEIDEIFGDVRTVRSDGIEEKTRDIAVEYVSKGAAGRAL